MKGNELIQQLKERGLIAQITEEKKLIEKLTSKKIVLYCGFDPTSDSLHIGHLGILTFLKRFQLAGHKIIILIGGATGIIGDPSFKSFERKLNSLETIKNWIKKIKKQILIFVKSKFYKKKLIIVNNYDWFNSMNIFTLLRDIGKHFSINQMINKESVKNRLKNNNSISFTEFSYNILQGYDFCFLNKKYNALLQIGGSDQWGNIISGIDLTRKLNKKKVYGITIPLITQKNGKKFGKTENGNIWLDPIKTSPYKFYQFWLNIDDKDIYRFLKIFTFLDINTIKLIEKTKKKKNKIPNAKYILAEELTRIVHGEEKLISAKRISNSLFNNKLENLTKKDFFQLSLDGISKININFDVNLQNALVLTKLANSYRKARDLIISESISINGKKQTSLNYVFNNNDKLYGIYTLLKKGKKNFFLINWK